MNRRQRIVVLAGAVMAVVLVLFPPWQARWTIVTLWGQWPPPKENRRIVEAAEPKAQTVYRFLFLGPDRPPEKERVLPALARIVDRRTGETEVVAGIENRNYERRILYGRLALELLASACLTALLFRAFRKRARPSSLS